MSREMRLGHTCSSDGTVWDFKHCTKNTAKRKIRHIFYRSQKACIKAGSYEFSLYCRKRASANK